MLHVNDAASTTHQLVGEAHRRGLDWRYLPLAGTRTGAGPEGAWRRAARGAAWSGRLAAASATTDVLHVHGGTVVRHTRWVPRPYVLHLHGTDVRSHQYDPRHTATVRRGLRDASAVFYSTPDLAEHVLPWRSDAVHVPQPMDLAALPPWGLDQDRAPVVFFASRWETVKGSTVQLPVARALRAALPPSTRVVGLDWGADAPRARAAGVELLPRQARSRYLSTLASASVVVGQCSGMLAASEVEALGIGVPVVAPLRAAWYPQDPPPVVGPACGATPPGEDGGLVTDVVESVLGVLADPLAVAAGTDGPSWVARHHDVRDAVDRLVGVYARIIEERAARPARRSAGS